MGDGEALRGEEIASQAEASLARLQIDEIDLLLIHSVDQYGEGPRAVERIIDSGMVEALERLKAAGKIRHYGVSGMLPELTGAVRTGSSPRPSPTTPTTCWSGTRRGSSCPWRPGRTRACCSGASSTAACSRETRAASP